MRLQDALESAGVKQDAGQVEIVIMDTFAEMFGSIPDEELLCRPSKASAFAREVRKRLDTQKLSDYRILRTLSNLRKRSRLQKGPK